MADSLEVEELRAMVSRLQKEKEELLVENRKLKEGTSKEASKPVCSRPLDYNPEDTKILKLRKPVQFEKQQEASAKELLQLKKLADLHKENTIHTRHAAEAFGWTLLRIDGKEGRLLADGDVTLWRACYTYRRDKAKVSSSEGVVFTMSKDGKQFEVKEIKPRKLHDLLTEHGCTFSDAYQASSCLPLG